MTKILDWKPFQKNTLRAFFGVALPSGMMIHGLQLHEKAGSRWIGMPAREYEKDGQKAWAKIIEFQSRDAADRFRDAVLEAIDQMQSTPQASTSRTTPAASSQRTPREAPF